MNSVIKRLAATILLFLTFGSLSAQYPSGAEVLQKIDDNMASRNRVVTSKMIIHGRRGSRTISSKSWVQGTEKSFTADAAKEPWKQNRGREI